MISKEKFRRYVNELTGKENQNFNKGTNSSGNSFFPVMGWILFIIGLVTFTSGIGIVFVFLGIIFLLIGSATSSKKAVEKRNYRNKYIGEVLSCLLEGYTYKFDSEGKIDESIFDESQFVDKYDIYEGSDKLSINIPNDDGRASSTYLTLCDLDVKKIEIRRKSVNTFGIDQDTFNTGFGGDYEDEEFKVNVYRGVFGYVEFPFQFKCVLGLNGKYRKRGVNLEVVRLEGMEFHKKFGVYCNDQIEARYILTPDMMGKLLRLHNTYKGMKLVLVDNKMYFCFPNKNLLELRTYKGNDSIVFDGIYDDISNILSVVEEIKNNNKIFRM